MVQVFNPSNDVELNIFTTEPSWATEGERINTDAVNGDFWRTFGFLKRDLRLGNLSPKYDDFEWLDNQIQLTQNIVSFRGGRLSSVAPMALIKVVGTVELSHSRSGFLRRWFRTFNVTGDQEERGGGGFFGGLFGKKRGGY